MSALFDWIDAAPPAALLAIALGFIAVFLLLWKIAAALEQPACGCPFYWLKKQDGTESTLKQFHDRFCPNRAQQEVSNVRDS